MGPIAHRAQHESVLTRIDEAVADGAHMVAGGPAEGLFVRPTVFADVSTCPPATGTRSE